MADYDIIINGHLQGFLTKQVKDLSDEMRNLYTQIDRINDQTKNYNRAQRAVNTALGIGSDGQRVYAKTTMDAARNAAILKNNLKLVKRQASELNQQFGKNRLTASLKAAIGRANEFDKQLLSASKNLRNIQKASRAIRFTSAIRDAQSLSKNFLNMGKNLQYVGRNLTIGLTLPLVQFFRFGLDSFKRLETEVIRFNKIVGGATLKAYEEQEAALYRLEKRTVDGFKDPILVEVFDRTGTAAEALTRDLDNVSYRFGVARDLVQGIAADFATIGLTDTRVIADLTSLTAAIEKVGDVDITTSREFIQALFLGAINTQNFNDELRNNLSTIDQYRLAVDQIRGTLALFNTVENNTVVTMQKLSKAVPEMIAVTNLYGLTTTEAAAAFAPMIAAGFEVGASGNSIKVSLQRLVAPAKQNREILNELANTVTDFNFEVGVGVESVSELARAFIALENAKGMQGALELYARLFGVRQGSRMLTAFVELSRFQEDLANSATEAYNIANTIVDNVNKAVIESGLEDELRRALGGGMFTGEDIAKLGQIARVAGDEYAKGFDSGGTALYKAITEGQSNANAELEATLDGAGDVLDRINSQAGKIILAQARGIGEAGAELEEELERALASPAVKLARAKETFKSISRQLIPPLVDALDSLTPTIKRLADFIKDMPQGLRTLISTGLLITMVFGPIVTVFSNLTQGIGLLAGGMFKLIGSISKFSLLGRGGTTIAADTLAGVKNLDKFGSKLSRISEDAYFFKGTKKQFNRALNRSVAGARQSGAAESDVRRLLRLQALYEAYNKKLGATQAVQGAQAQSNVVLSKSQQRQILAIQHVSDALDLLKVKIADVTAAISGQSGVINTVVSQIRALGTEYSNLGKSINGVSLGLAGKGGKGGLNGKMKTFATAAVNAGRGASQLTASMIQLMRHEAGIDAAITKVATALDKQAVATNAKRKAMGTGAASLPSKIRLLADAEKKLAIHATAAAAAMHRQANAIDRMVAAIGRLDLAALSSLSTLAAGGVAAPAGKGATAAAGATKAPAAPRAPPAPKPAGSYPGFGAALAGMGAASVSGGTAAAAPPTTPAPVARPKPRPVPRIPTPVLQPVPASTALAGVAAARLNDNLQKQILEAFAKTGKIPAPEALYAMRHMDLAAATGRSSLNKRGVASLEKALASGVLGSLPGGGGFRAGTGSGFAAILSKEIARFLASTEAFSIGQKLMPDAAYGLRPGSRAAPSRFVSPPKLTQVAIRSNAAAGALANTVSDPRTVAASKAYKDSMRILSQKTKQAKVQMVEQSKIIGRSRVSAQAAGAQMDRIRGKAASDFAVRSRINTALKQQLGMSITQIRKHGELMLLEESELKSQLAQGQISKQQFKDQLKYRQIRASVLAKEVESDAKYLALKKAKEAAEAEQIAAMRKQARLRRIMSGLNTLETDIKRTIGPGTAAYNRGMTTPVRGLRSIRTITASPAENVAMMSRYVNPADRFLRRLPQIFGARIAEDAANYQKMITKKIMKGPGDAAYKAAVIKRTMDIYNKQVIASLTANTKNIIKQASAQGLTGAKASKFIRQNIASSALPQAFMAGRNISQVAGGAGGPTFLQGILSKYGMNVAVYEKQILQNLQNQIAAVKKQIASAASPAQAAKLNKKLKNLESSMRLLNREMTDPQIKALEQTRLRTKEGSARAIRGIKRVARSNSKFTQLMKKNYSELEAVLNNGQRKIDVSGRGLIYRMMWLVNNSIDHLDEIGDAAQEMAAVIDAQTDPVKAAVAEVAAETKAATVSMVESVKETGPEQLALAFEGMEQAVESATAGAVGEAVVAATAATDAVANVGDEFEQLALTLTSGSEAICAGLTGATGSVVEGVPVTIKSVKEVEDELEALAVAVGLLGEGVGAAVDEVKAEAAEATAVAVKAIDDIDPFDIADSFAVMSGFVEGATEKVEAEILTTSAVVRGALREFGSDLLEIGRTATVFLGPVKAAGNFAVGSILKGSQGAIGLLTRIGSAYNRISAAVKGRALGSARLVNAGNLVKSKLKSFGTYLGDIGKDWRGLGSFLGSFPSKVPGASRARSAVGRIRGGLSGASITKVREAINMSGIMSGSVLTTEWSKIGREIKIIGTQFKPIASFVLRGIKVAGKASLKASLAFGAAVFKGIGRIGKTVKSFAVEQGKALLAAGRAIKARSVAVIRSGFSRFGAAWDRFYTQANISLKNARESVKTAARSIKASSVAGWARIKAGAANIRAGISGYWGSITKTVVFDGPVAAQEATAAVASAAQPAIAKARAARQRIGAATRALGRAVVRAISDPGMFIADAQLMIGISIDKMRPKIAAATARVRAAIRAAQFRIVTAFEYSIEFAFNAVSIAVTKAFGNLSVIAQRAIASIRFAGTRARQFLHDVGVTLRTVGAAIRSRARAITRAGIEAVRRVSAATANIVRFIFTPGNVALTIGLKLDGMRTKMKAAGARAMAKFRTASTKFIQFITDPATIGMVLAIYADRGRARVRAVAAAAKAKIDAARARVLLASVGVSNGFMSLLDRLEKAGVSLLVSILKVKAAATAKYEAAKARMLLAMVAAGNAIVDFFDRAKETFKSIWSNIKTLSLSIWAKRKQILPAALAALKAIGGFIKASLSLIGTAAKSFWSAAKVAWNYTKPIRTAGIKAAKAIAKSGFTIGKSMAKISFSFAKMGVSAAVVAGKITVQLGKALAVVGSALITAKSTARVAQMQAAAQKAGTTLGRGTVFRTAFSESIQGTRAMVTQGWGNVIAAQKGLLNTVKTLGKTVGVTLLNSIKLFGSLAKAPVQILAGTVQALKANMGGIFEIGKAIGNVFKNVVKLASDLVKGLLTAATQLAKTVLSTVMTIGKSMMSVLKSVTKFLVLGITFGPLILGAAALVIAMKRLATSFKGTGEEAENAKRLKERFTNALKGLKEAIVALLRPFAEAFNAMFGMNSAVDQGSNAFNTLASVVLSVMERIGDSVKRFAATPGFIRFAQKAVAAMKQVLEIAKAVFNGIKSFIKGDSEEASNFFGQAFARMKYYGLSLASVLAPIWGGLIKFMMERLQQFLNSAIPAFLKVVEFLAHNFGPPIVKIMGVVVQKALDALFKLPEFLPDIIFAMLEGWAKFNVWSATIIRKLVLKLLGILLRLIPGLAKILGEMLVLIGRFTSAAAEKVGGLIKFIDPTYWAQKISGKELGTVLGVDLGEGLFGGLIGGVGDGIGWLTEKLDGALEFDWTDNAVTDFFDGIIDDAVDFGDELGDKTQDALTQIFDGDTVTGWKESMSNAIRDGLSGAKDSISGMIDELLYGSADDIAGPIQEINGALQGGLMGLLENLDLPEWEGSGLQESMNNLFDKVGPEVDRRVADFIADVEERKQEIRDTFEEKFGVAFEALPGRQTALQAEIRETAREIGRAYANAIDAGGEGLDNMAEDVGKAVEDALKDATQRFVDTVVDILGNAVSDLKSDLTDALSDQRDAALQYFDDQISAIEALEKAEEELFRKQEQIESDRQRNRDRALQRENYRRNRSLAIYEGRIDDARQLDLEERKASESFDQETGRITRDRIREEQSRQRDTVKDILKRQKEDAKETFDDIIDNFEEFVEKIGKYGTYNQEELEQQFAEIREAAKSASIDLTDAFEDYYKEIPELIARYTDPTVGFFENSLQSLVDAAKDSFGLGFGSGSDTLLGATALMLSTYNNTFEGKLGEAEDTFQGSVDSIVDVILGPSITEMNELLEGFNPDTIFEEALVEANTIMQREFAKMIDSHNSLVGDIVKGMDQLTIDLVSSMAKIQSAAGSAANSVGGLKDAMDEANEAADNFTPPQFNWVNPAHPEYGVMPDNSSAGGGRPTYAFNGGAIGAYAMGGIVKRYGMGGKIKKYALGGYSVPGFGSTAVPAILHGGEFVINSKAVSNIGMAALQGLNNMRFRNIRMPSSSPVSVSSSTNTTNIYVENFIGQDEWFNSMMKEYNVKVHRRNQKSAGLENRNISTYTGLNRGM